MAGDRLAIWFLQQKTLLLTGLAFTFCVVVYLARQPVGGDPLLNGKLVVLFV